MPGAVTESGRQVVWADNRIACAAEIFYHVAQLPDVPFPLMIGQKRPDLIRQLKVGMQPVFEMLQKQKQVCVALPQRWDQDRQRTAIFFFIAAPL